MKNALLLAVLLAVPPAHAADTFTAEQMRQDLRVAHDALVEGHPGVTRFTSRAELDRAFRDAERQIEKGGDAWAFYRVIAPAVAHVRCGHTAVQLPGALQEELTTTHALLPAQVWIEGKKLWVFRDLSTADGHWAGREVLAIDGRPAPEIIEKITASMPRDGFSETSIATRLHGWRFATQLVRVLGGGPRWTMELRDPRTGAREIVTAEGRSLPELKKVLAERFPGDLPPARPAAIEFLDDGKIARLTIHQFGGAMNDSGTVRLGAWLETAFADIDQHGTRELILDLRGNGGGQDELGRILLAHLVDQPFDYYADLVINAPTFSFGRYQAKADTVPADFVEAWKDGKLHCVKHPNWGRQQPARPTFAGRVFVLMDGASFSTTCEFLSHVRDLGRATFIGAETGGAYVGNTSGFTSEVPLPNTRLVLGIPLMRYDLAVKPVKAPGRGIQPDVPVAATIEERIAGKDPELEVALKMARTPVAAR